MNNGSGVIYKVVVPSSEDIMAWDVATKALVQGLEMENDGRTRDRGEYSLYCQYKVGVSSSYLVRMSLRT